VEVEPAWVDHWHTRDQRTALVCGDADSGRPEAPPSEVIRVTALASGRVHDEDHTGVTRLGMNSSPVATI